VDRLVCHKNLKQDQQGQEDQQVERHSTLADQTVPQQQHQFNLSCKSPQLQMCGALLQTLQFQKPLWEITVCLCHQQGQVEQMVMIMCQPVSGRKRTVLPGQ
jgi:hypothetical protein